LFINAKKSIKTFYKPLETLKTSELRNVFQNLDFPALNVLQLFVTVYSCLQSNSLQSI